MNRVVLFGRLGHAPELRMSQGGHASLRLRIATSEKIKRGDKWEETTEWHNTIVWGKRAEALAQILQKGGLVLIEGRLRTNEYEDRDGVKRYSTEVVVLSLEFGGDKRNRSGSAGNRPPAGEPDGDPDDDIPY